MRIDETFLESTVSGLKILQGSVSFPLSFSIDSRSLNKGDVFVALVGEHSDGHEHLNEALKRGAKGVMIAKKKQDRFVHLDKKLYKSSLVIVVEDPLKALLLFARAWRKRLSIPIVAITGSVGKTSTKMILGSIVRESGASYMVARGNQNTLLGVALNILRVNDTHDGAIFEVGINQRGEMSRIVDLLRPTTGLITSVGHSHMEGLGSLADISIEKRDVFKYFKEDSIGFVNGDQDVLAHVAYPHPIIKFGFKTTNQIQARKVIISNSHIRLVLKLYNEKHPLVLPYVHKGMVSNVLAAIAIAQHIKISHEVIIRAVEKPVIVARRFERQVIANSENVVIDDCYNANPESMKAALLAFQTVETDAQKIAVLGDMLELGTDSAFWHRQLGRFLRKVSTLKHVVLVGDLIKWTKKTIPVGISVQMVDSWEESIPILQKHLHSKSVLLVKGSRSIGLDKVVDHFLNNNEKSLTEARGILHPESIDFDGNG